jgi:putative transposase
MDPTQPNTRIPWPHAPEHRLSESGTFIVTAGTYRKRHFFRDQHTLQILHNGLLKYANHFHWRLEAWAVFSNHYHFICHSPADAADGAESLSTFLNRFHSKSSAWLNERDDAEGRQVWHNFWETRLTHERSYLARLNYVHQNAVRHGLVHVADQYPWCSAGWFQRTATRAQVNTIYSFPTDRLNVLDEFDPIWAKKSP